MIKVKFESVKIEEKLLEDLFEIYNTDTHFQDLIMGKATELLDVYDYDDVDFLDENASSYLEDYLLDDMLEKCQESIPYTLKEVRELAYSVLEVCHD